jgi:Ser/Thr protein kinase RdoA (MazF antagonist)
VTGGAAPGLVHGMGKELAEPDWAALTDAEVRAVLARYPEAGPGAAVAWTSPRPMSAAALAVLPGGVLFVKRHHVRVRTVAQLSAEHRFAGWLRARGVPVPPVLRTAGGATATRRGAFVYEVHRAAGGVDLYRDRVSWSPFLSPGHARAAGAALARLHRAAAGFPLPARSPGPLLSGCDVVIAADPLAAIGDLIGHRPGLAGYLAGQDWRRDLTRQVLPAVRRAAARLAPLRRQWGHGDWHPSNLTWTSTGAGADVAAVIDFGLANRTFAVHDLATALERAAVSWLDLAESGRAAADLAAADALLDGYQQVRPLSPAEAAALPDVLPVVHLEYALSEVEYFAGIVQNPGYADLAYHGYLLGHTRWFRGPDGARMLGHLRRRARPGRWS